MKDPEHLNPLEVATEIHDSRDRIVRELRHIAECSAVLRAKAKHPDFIRVTDQTEVSKYVAFANGWGRLAGAFDQGFRRMSAVDRLMRTITEEQTARRQRVAEEEARLLAEQRRDRRQARSSLYAISQDFDALYGTET